jgi:MYXO-CTERM domain-containing protein
MLALEAGASGGEGDSRCTPAGIPSDSGFIHVDLADGSEFLHLSVTATAPGSPVVHLRSLYDAWRAEHPCPGLPDEAPDASADASEDPGLDLLEDTPPDLPEDPAPDDEVDPEMVGIVPGCGCSTAPGSPASAAPLLLAAGLLLACRRKV